MVDIRNYGYDGNEAGVARVMAAHRERYELMTAGGEAFGRLKGSAYYGTQDYPTTGDFVQIQENPLGDQLIARTLPRKSMFVRNDFSGHAKEYVKTVKGQVVAANFDEVFILISLNHDFKLARAERYLALAWESGARPVLILTKADLAEDWAERARHMEGACAGAPVHAISAHTGQGLEALAQYLKPGRTIALLGSSGVGKSSLVNALSGWERMAVKDIREDDSRGRHTTTHRQLLMLDSGAMLIDTPGMRELGMWESSEGLDGVFSDVLEILDRRCRFSNCAHGSEPGCAVKAALQSGELSQRRWERYLALKKESRFVQDKSLTQREKQAKGKQIAMDMKVRKKYVGH